MDSSSSYSISAPTTSTITSYDAQATSSVVTLDLGSNASITYGYSSATLYETGNDSTVGSSSGNNVRQFSDTGPVGLSSTYTTTFSSANTITDYFTDTLTNVAALTTSGLIVSGCSIRRLPTLARRPRPTTKPAAARCTMVPTTRKGPTTIPSRTRCPTPGLRAPPWAWEATAISLEVPTPTSIRASARTASQSHRPAAKFLPTQREDRPILRGLNRCRSSPPRSPATRTAPSRSAHGRRHGRLGYVYLPSGQY